MLQITPVTGLGTLQMLQNTAFASLGMSQMLQITPANGSWNAQMLSVTAFGLGTFQMLQITVFHKDRGDQRTMGPEDHGTRGTRDQGTRATPGPSHTCAKKKPGPHKNPGTTKVLKCSTPILGEGSSTRQGSSELEVQGLEFRTYASRLIL